jgi:hypothetical protein
MAPNIVSDTEMTPKLVRGYIENFRVVRYRDAHSFLATLSRETSPNMSRTTGIDNIENFLHSFKCHDSLQYRYTLNECMGHDIMQPRTFSRAMNARLQEE